MSAINGFVMCLVNREQELVAYLKQDWASLPAQGPVTGAISEAWTTGDSPSTSLAESFTKLYGVHKIGARFELRERALCPASIAP